MENKQYLNEERYQKNKKKITFVAIVVLIVGLLLGGFLIFTGLNQHSESNKQKLAEEKQKVIASKEALENKIKPIEDEIKELSRVSYNDGKDAYYDAKDRIEELEKSIEEEKKNIETIEDALDDSFAHCEYDGPKNNYYTSQYCSLKVKVNENYNALFYVLGGFVLLITFAVSGSIYATAKGREITAFYTQQQMPVAKEGIDEMAPSASEAAKEIAKGVKEGLKDEEK